MPFQRWTYLSIIGLLFFTHTLEAQTSKYSNEFMNIGVGARAQAMGNSVTASLNDITAGYWNPAALANVKSPFQINAQHAEWFAGIANYDYIAVGLPIGQNRKGFASVSMIRLGIDQIPYTLNLINPDGSVNYDNITEFSAADYGFLTSYGQRFKDSNWLIGGSAKVIHRSIGQFGKAWGFGIDVGAYRSFNNFRMAFVGKDLSTTFNAWSFTLTEEEKLVFAATGNDIPVSSVEKTLPRLIVAFAYDIKTGKRTVLTVETDFDITTDGKRSVLLSADPISIDPHIGFEFKFKDFLALRAGFNNMQILKDPDNPTYTDFAIQPNVGVGLILGQIGVDYALTNVGSFGGSLYSNVFSIRLDLKERAHKSEVIENL